MGIRGYPFMPITPIKDQIIIRQDAPKEKLDSGLYLPQGHRDLHDDFGTVLAVGPGRITSGGVRIPMEVKPGDRVLFKRRPASALVRDPREGGYPKEWENILVLREDDILGIVEVDG